MRDLTTAFQGVRVLITGGLGFIGSNLTHRLVALGAEVTIADSLLPLYGGNHYNLKGAEDRVQVKAVDIRDQAAIEALVQGQEIIYNLAAQVSYLDSISDPLLDLDINCRGHLVVLEACRRFNPTARVLFAGSRMQYGITERSPVPETHRLAPLSIYGIHKTTGELYYGAYHHLYDLPTVGFRITNPYGPRHQMKHSKYGIVNYFIKLAMQNRTIKVFGDGSQIRDYIYVDDVVEVLCVAAVVPEAVGGVFNIGGGVGMRFIDMAKYVVAVVGQGQVVQEPWPESYFNIETGPFIADISRARKLLRWEPKVELMDGIQRTYEYYLEHGEAYWSEASESP